ncbi:MAG: penicillin acylase family protein [Rhodospirillales bacterium]|nr:penicillin acylase family protein [Rhodospirillales bacterium]
MRRTLRLTTWTFGLVPALAIVVLGAGLAWLRGSLPQLDGNLEVAGLEAPVEVLRDADGIVTIRARNERDAYLALGFVHAQDRLWQMDFMRRTGAGRLSEVVGAETLELDRLMRGLGLYRVAQANLTWVSPETRAALEAYAAGVNAYIAAPSGPWAPEFQLLRYEPEPWRPTDSLVWGRLMALQLSNNWGDEILRRRLAGRLAPEQIEFLWPRYPADAPVTVSDADGQKRAGIPPDDSQVAASELDLFPSPSHRFAAGPSLSPRERVNSPAHSSLFSLPLEERDDPTVPCAPSPLSLGEREGPAADRRWEGEGQCPGPASPLEVLPWAWAPKDASNVWVIAGERTASGRPILANDPHLGLEAPGIWYLARIETPELTLAGATAPGVPFLLAGHNGRIAWGFTTTHADTQDLFVERLSAGTPGHYDTPEGPRPFTTHEEIIEVKGQAAIKLTLRETRHGPVLSDLRPGYAAGLPQDQVLALAWPALRADDRGGEAIYRLNHARDSTEFLAAMAEFHSPVQNVAYADTAGNIGFVAAGRIPLRKAGDGRVPVPGWDGVHDWAGYIPFQELPQSLNPPFGQIVNANNRIVDRGYPHLITTDWPDSHRARRIEERLSTKLAATVEMSLALQQDTLSPAARQLLPLLLDAPLQPDATRPARDLLANWDHRMTRDRPEPLLFYAWMAALNEAVFADELGESFPAFQRANADLLWDVLTSQPEWCDDTTTARIEDCAEQVSTALLTATTELEERFGPEIDDWRWGAAHVARFPHPVLQYLPLAEELLGFPVEADGGFYTVNRGGARFGGAPESRFADVHGAGFRAVYDLADLDNSRFMIATGQSGNPLSPLYGSLAQRWRDGDYLKLVGGGTKVAHRLTLNPR